MRLQALTKEGEHVTVVAIVGTDAVFKAVVVNIEGRLQVMNPSDLTINLELSDELGPKWPKPVDFNETPQVITQKTEE
jgi:hypothetical protein